MMLRFAAFLIFAPPISTMAQPAPPPAHPAPQSRMVRVAITTSMGPIVLDLDAGRAPVTTANFLRYVDQKRYDGCVFWRAMRITPTYGVIQGGWKGDPKKVLPPIAHEPTTKTGIRHEGEGVVSMARLAPGTANSDFFITLSTMPAFDADPTREGDKAGYAAFGRVVEGMDVVRKIYDAPLSPTAGQGSMKGQMLAPPIRIVTARRVKIAIPIP